MNIGKAKRKDPRDIEGKFSEDMIKLAVKHRLDEEDFADQVLYFLAHMVVCFPEGQTTRLAGMIHKFSTFVLEYEEEYQAIQEKNCDLKIKEKQRLKEITGL